MTRDGAINPTALARYRAPLRTLAQHHLGRRVQDKLDASDIVQQALLTAYEKRDQFRGRTEPELFGWIRSILRREVALALRRFRAARRDVGKERPLAGNPSHAWNDPPGATLAGKELSPSQSFLHHEQQTCLAQALAQLPPEQRCAIELHHLQGQSVAQVAQALGRSKSAVVGLLYRGLKKLRQLIESSSHVGREGKP